MGDECRRQGVHERWGSEGEPSLVFWHVPYPVLLVGEREERTSDDDDTECGMKIINR